MRISDGPAFGPMLPRWELTIGTPFSQGEGGKRQLSVLLKPKGECRGVGVLRKWPRRGPEARIHREVKFTSYVLLQ